MEIEVQLAPDGVFLLIKSNNEAVFKIYLPHSEALGLGEEISALLSRREFPFQVVE